MYQTVRIINYRVTMKKKMINPIMDHNKHSKWTKKTKHKNMNTWNCR